MTLNSIGYWKENIGCNATILRRGTYTEYLAVKAVGHTESEFIAYKKQQ